MILASERKRRPHGHLVNCPGGYWAYIPAPLPPHIAWDGALAAALSAADRAVGRLDVAYTTARRPVVSAPCL